MNDEDEQDRLREVFLDWLDAEASGGYRNSVGRWGLVGIVREYRDVLPLDAQDALSNYASLSLTGREEALALAITAVVSAIGAAKSSPALADDPVAPKSGTGLHPDYATWAGLAGVQTNTVGLAFPEMLCIQITQLLFAAL